MDCADAGHILVSKRVAEDLAQRGQWHSRLHDLGECSVKHEMKVHVLNLCTADAGNAELPAAIKRQREEKRAPAPTSLSRLYGGRNLYLIAAVLLAAATAAVVLLVRPSPISDKSIAVLPFENLSDEKENAFFADGIQDDILTSLSQIEGLRVISRTSVMGYRGAKASWNLRYISKALGVANVLEGSVRREGNRVVVAVQLIDARRDRHIWANRYDRTLADSLGLQGELAAEIAEALRVTLSPDEKARVQTKPTGNTDAYVVYLRANQIQRNPDTLLEDYKTAERLYRQAIALDPNFALAHARLASTCAAIFHFHEPLDAWKDKARAEAELALGLQPNLAEAHLALGQYIYWIEGEYDRALQEFDQALRLSPNNAEIGELIAAVKRRQGHWQDAIAAYERNQKIDPQNANIVRNLVFTNTALRRWPEASRWAAQMRAMAPASLVAKIQSGYVDFWWKGETHLLKSLLTQVPAGTDPDGVITSCRWEAAMIDRDFAAARAILQNSGVKANCDTNGAA